jgi:hypothetical protein
MVINQRLAVRLDDPLRDRGAQPIERPRRSAAREHGAKDKTAAIGDRQDRLAWRDQNHQLRAAQRNGEPEGSRGFYEPIHAGRRRRSGGRMDREVSRRHQITRMGV